METSELNQMLRDESRTIYIVSWEYNSAYVYAGPRTIRAISMHIKRERERKKGIDLFLTAKIYSYKSESADIYYDIFDGTYGTESLIQ